MEFISSNNEILTPSKKAEIQNKILLDVYDETYPLWDINRAIEQIKSGTQRILFWWKSFDEISSWRWWTMALIQDTSKSPSTVEMCRAGSNVNNWWWLQAVSRLFTDFFESPFNQLYATPRNCLDRLNENKEVIPWWKAISTIYSRHKDIQYWWIAPWYIMPGNALELLDLRIYTKQDLCYDRLKNWDKVYIGSAADREIFWEMIESNYHVNDFFWDSSFPLSDIDYSFSVKFDHNNDLRKFNYSMYEVEVEWPIWRREIEDSMKKIWSGVNLVKLDLFDKKNILAQEHLKEIWFKMVSLFPEWKKMMWYWFKSDNHNYAIPHYYTEQGGKSLKSISLQKEIIKSIIAW
ncbi:MAG: hypothetical protein ACD_3C00135G0003 [uncultured bacterium (gcode 4)]|uniref:Uncharacterized protein n=1 Tax=uncultured bacterium (gcode 4) TaxID=1234023 RepID=K2GWZ5_9BACT|nr:MAG: hypothetical protein ACD_3C00135G0003 [uncultured bacterium (gcode 4)]